MKIIIKRNVFLKNLQIIYKTIDINSIIPILSNVLLEVDKNKAFLSSTNYKIGTKVQFDVKSKDVFSVAIPAKIIFELVNLIFEEELEIKFNKEKLGIEISTQKSKNFIKCFNADEFPIVPVLEKEKSISLSSLDFRESLQKVVISSSTDKNNLLNGINIKVDEDQKLSLFAVDGFHLSYDLVKLNSSKRIKDFNAIVNSDSLDILLNIIQEKGTLLIQVTENQIRFNLNSINIVMQKTSGNFPDPKQFKLEGQETFIIISAQELLDACKQTELFTNENKTALIEVKKNLIKISSFATEKGNNEFVINDAKITGKQIDFGIDITLLRQFLELCKSKEIKISLIDNEKGILFEIKDISDFYHIIMPMKLLENKI